MSNFTVNTLGDATLTANIIDRSITELKDELLYSIGQYALAGCTDLASVELSKCESIGAGAFQRCSAMTKLILRTGKVAALENSNAFTGSAVANGTGYIYVPAAVYDGYIADSVWSTYKSQIRAMEDYPLETDLYNWSSVALAIEQGVYAEKYAIGDTIPLNLGSEGIVNMQIVAFDTDPLADGSGNSHITFISKELTTSHRMNPSRVENDDGTYQEGTGCIGGWKNSEMRTYLTGTIKPLIPSDVASMIKTVTKYSRSYDTSGASVSNEVTSDDVWIPSYKEVNLSSNWSYESSAPCYSTAFPDSTSRIKYPVGFTSPSNWWLRSASGGNIFYHVLYSSGNGYTNDPSISMGVALGFCV